MNESDEDRLIGEWHELARNVEVGAPVDLPAAVDVLNEVLCAFAPTLRCPQDQATIPPFVVNTRQLERLWNVRLGKALVDAGEAKRKTDLAAALTILDQFAEQCPWVPFVRIARDQRANYAAGR